MYAIDVSVIYSGKKKGSEKVRNHGILKNKNETTQEFIFTND